MSEKVINRQFGTEGKKFLMFTNDLPTAAQVLNLFDVWNTQLMVVGTRRVYKQINKNCPQLLPRIHFRLLSNIQCDVLYEDVKAFDPDYVVTFSYFYKLPERLFTIARKLAFNLHPSLLPYYKGSAPHTKPLENSDEYFGYSVHELTNQFDQGKILLQMKYPVRLIETEFSILSALPRCCLETLKVFLGKLDRDLLDNMENPTDLPMAIRRKYKDFWLNPALSVNEIERFVRARNLLQGPQVNIKNQRAETPTHVPLSIQEVLIRKTPPQAAMDLEPGHLVLIEENMYFKAADGVLEITVVTHPEFGIMSMKRYCQIEGIQQGVAIPAVYPGDFDRNKPLADKLAVWYYHEVEEKFSPESW